MDTLLCPPLLRSSCGFKRNRLLKGRKSCGSVGNQCPMPVWLLETTWEKVEQLLCLGRYFLSGHCSRKVALTPDYCRLMAHDDSSTACPAGNTTPGWVSLVELDIRGRRFENRVVWSHTMEGNTVTSKSIGVLHWDFTSTMVKKNSLLWLTLFSLKD